MDGGGDAPAVLTIHTAASTNMLPSPAIPPNNNNGVSYDYSTIVCLSVCRWLCWSRFHLLIVACVRS
jgi:hypothetical protein